MAFFQKLRQLLRSPIDAARSLAAIHQGIANQSRLLDEKATALIEGSDNQSRTLHERLDAVTAGLDNQSRTLNERLDAVIAGLDNQSRTLNERLQAVIAVLDNQSRLLDNKLDAVIAALDNLARTGAAHNAAATASATDAASAVEPTQKNRLKVASPDSSPQGAPAGEALPRAPLLIAHKTYNTSHPDYDATLVRNFPGQILNDELPCSNPVYSELKKLSKGNDVPDDAWTPVLEQALADAMTVPHADLVLQRRDALERYTAELGRRYNARYIAGWVNLDDALFLYWLVRRLKPKTILQCGVCNGLSSAFMMLALAKNGPEGRLHVIDIPPVFDPEDPAWTIADTVYGVVIPEGKTSGWMVPEAYRERFEVLNGDAKLLLPKLVDQLDAIDMFYHDSDHTYDHMMFEFREAKRKLAPEGLIVADDISWNSSLWDFADQHAVPAYNFKGAVGVTFF